MSKLSFKAKVKKYSNGGYIKKMQPGGLVQGPSHEEGGVGVVDETSQPIAEVEGGERIFSVEDTQAMEQAAVTILQTAQQNPAAADEMAKELGYMVAGMLVKQEMVNPTPPEAQAGNQSLPPEMMSGSAGELAIPPGGGNEYLEQPI